MNNKTRAIVTIEARKIAKASAESIVDERIIPKVLDEIGYWVGELMGKMNNIDAEKEHEVEDSVNIIHNVLVAEVIKQLQKQK